MNTKNLRFRSNSVRDIQALFHLELDPLYGAGEVSAFVEMLFEAFLGWSRVRLLSSRSETVNQSDLLRFHWALEDLKAYRPIQHIVGHVDFCGCRIAVSPAVLIPRPETEELVGLLREHFASSATPGAILDLCTGSGCIAIALAKAFPTARVAAVDISAEALTVARENATNNGVEVAFHQADVLASRWDEALALPPLSLIVSNPPYVRESERAAMQRNVLDHEPGLALFVSDADPLVFYRAVAAVAGRRLAAAGLLALEINEALAAETCALLRERGFEPTLHQDFRGRDRMVIARRR